MGYKSWRDDPNMMSKTTYKKRFAFWQIVCEDGTKIWWKNYYSVYRHWATSYFTPIGTNPGMFSEDMEYHTDYVGRITEAEYLVRKLSESL